LLLFFYFQLFIPETQIFLVTYTTPLLLIVFTKIMMNIITWFITSIEVYYFYWCFAGKGNSTSSQDKPLHILANVLLSIWKRSKGLKALKSCRKGRLNFWAIRRIAKSINTLMNRCQKNRKFKQNSPQECHRDFLSQC
jgi:hypothetical protein